MASRLFEVLGFITVLHVSVSGSIYSVNGNGYVCPSDEVSYLCTQRVPWLNLCLSINNRGSIFYCTSFSSDSNDEGTITTLPLRTTPNRKELISVNSSSLTSSISIVTPLSLNSVTISCNWESKTFQIKYCTILPTTDISLLPMDNGNGTYNFTMTWTPMTCPTEKYSISISHNFTNTTRKYQTSTGLMLQTGINYNIAITLCSDTATTRHFRIGLCPFLTPTASFKVLYYNISLNGYQQAVVTRCDGQGPYVLECSSEREWQHPNTTNICMADPTAHIFSKNETIDDSPLDSITAPTSVSTSEPAYTTTSTEKINDLILISSITAGAAATIAPFLCIAVFLLGFFSGMLCNKKSSKKRTEGSGVAEQETVVYEEVQNLKNETSVVLQQNVAYERVHRL